MVPHNVVKIKAITNQFINENPNIFFKMIIKTNFRLNFNYKLLAVQVVSVSHEPSYSENLSHCNSLLLYSFDANSSAADRSNLYNLAILFSSFFE